MLVVLQLREIDAGGSMNLLEELKKKTCKACHEAQRQEISSAREELLDHFCMCIDLDKYTRPCANCQKINSVLGDAK